MAAPTYTLPTIGNPNSTEDPLIRTALSDLKTLLTAGVDTANLSSSAGVTSAQLAGSITDAKLASPNNSVYRTLLTAGSLGNSLTLATSPFFLGGQSAAFSGGAITAGSTAQSTQALSQALTGTGAVFVTSPSFIYFDDADFTVGSLTQKLRVRAQVNTNATAWSSVTATFGLYPVTFAGGTNTLTATLGTVVSGSTVAIANPSASTTNQGNSGDFTIPSDGQFCLGFALSANMTANSAALFTAQLQTRNV